MSIHSESVQVRNQLIYTRKRFTDLHAKMRTAVKNAVLGTKRAKERHLGGNTKNPSLLGGRAPANQIASHWRFFAISRYKTGANPDAEKRAHSAYFIPLHGC